jgi:hypothetical protein
VTDPTDNLIGPLTADEWCSFRQTGQPDDLLQCCTETSEIRDVIFGWLRMGGDAMWGRLLLEDVMPYIESHEQDKHPLFVRILEFIAEDRQP